MSGGRPEEEAMVAEEDDDSFMDWETRKESIPMLQHIVAGK